MPSEFPINDPRNIWQEQPTEAFKMSAAQLCIKSQTLQRRARFAVLWRMVLHLIFFVFFAQAVVNVRQMLVPIEWATSSLWCIRIGCGLISLWLLYGAYWVYKAIWPRRVTPDAALNTTLQSYRRELERQRGFYRPDWRKIMPGLLGMAIAMVPMTIQEFEAAPEHLVRAAPIALVTAVLWAICLVVLKRRRQKLQQEIEQLRAFERENLAS